MSRMPVSLVLALGAHAGATSAAVAQKPGTTAPYQGQLGFCSTAGLSANFSDRIRSVYADVNRSRSETQKWT